MRRRMARMLVPSTRHARAAAQLQSQMQAVLCREITMQRGMLHAGNQQVDQCMYGHQVDEEDHARERLAPQQGHHVGGQRVERAAEGLDGGAEALVARNPVVVAAQ
jgi:hypothetical protein